jgi:hypothetical protein
MKLKKSLVRILLVTVLIFQTIMLPVGAAENNGWQMINLKEAVDYTNPVLSVGGLNIDKAKVEGTVLFDSSNKQLEASFEYSGDTMRIIARNTLLLNTNYTVKIFMEDGKRIKLMFVTSLYPSIVNNGQRQVIYVPANPAKGFNWPYYIVIPSDQYRNENSGKKRYLMVESNNTGKLTKEFNECIDDTKSYAMDRQPHSLYIAERMWSPALIPVFPRPDITYTYNGENNMFYTHALDRDTATLHLKLKEAQLSGILTSDFNEEGYDVKSFSRLDVQLEAMVDDAIGNLNKKGQNIEKHKIFFSGYSASGTFADRFAFLHPDRIKAVAAGAANDDMVMPLSEYKGEKLMFPLGTSDYKDITGKSFNLAEQNKYAKLVYMGEDDENDVLPYTDCYGDEERRIITKLWGVEILPRAKQLADLYGKSGGKGIFILDKGIKHSYSTDMREYLLTFFQANRDSNTPVYPIPKNPGQLKYQIFK